MDSSTKKPTRLIGLLTALALLILLLSAALVHGEYAAISVEAAGTGTSLRFFGNGDNDIDRVKILVDGPPRPADVGAEDFTIEWWMKANPGDNSAQNCISGGDNWIYGNIIFDRDIWGDGDYGDYGISLDGGRLAFGVNNGSSGSTLCGGSNLDDGQWHHVAVTRRRADGQLSIFLDGALAAQADGPNGDVSYRDGRSASAPNEAYLVIGAEKHDAGSSYPSFSGWVDEVRISRTLRYAGNYVVPNAPFSADADTLALYHLDEGSGTVAGDTSGASGGPSDGVLHVGGSPSGPLWSDDTPWEMSLIYLPLLSYNYND